MKSILINTDNPQDMLHTLLNISKNTEGTYHLVGVFWYIVTDIFCKKMTKIQCHIFGYQYCQKFFIFHSLLYLTFIICYGNIKIES